METSFNETKHAILGYMIKRYLQFVVKNAYGVMAFVAIVTVFFLSQLGSVQTETDPKQILPQEHPYIETNSKIESLFGGGRVIVVGVVAKEGQIFTPTFLAKISRLTESIKTIKGIYADNVLSIASRKVKHLRFNDQGFNVERLMPQIPTNQEEADALKKRVFANPLYVGSLVSSDASAAAIIIDVQSREAFLESSKISGETFGDPPSDLDIYEALETLILAESDEIASIHLGGLPIALAFLEKDAIRMNRFIFPLAFIVIMLVHYNAFRTLQGMMIPALTALLSGLWALGLIGLFGLKLDLWTKGLTPILIVAMAAGHSVQILRRFYEALDYAMGMDVPEPAQKSAVVEATAKMAPVVLTAGFVAAASFASLITFKLPTFQSFGLMTAFGILSALVLEMTLIPALRSIIPPPSGEEMTTVLRGGRLDGMLCRIANWAATSSRPRVISLVLLACLLPLLFVTKIPLANSLRSLFFESTALRQDDAVLNQKFGGTSTLNILVSTEQEGGLKEPAVMRAIEGLQLKLQENPVVGRTESYVDYVKGMRRSFYDGKAEEGRVPDTRQEASQFLFLYSVSGNPDDFKRLADVPFKNAVIATFLKSDATPVAEALIKEIDDYATQYFPKGMHYGVAGSVPVTLALNEVIIRGKLLNIGQMMFIAFILSVIIFRSFIAGLFVLLPLIIAVSWNFGFLGLFGIPLGVSTAAASAMAVGMGADYAIYMLYRFKDELSVTRRLEAVLETTFRTAGRAILLVAVAFALGTVLVVFTGYYLHIEGVLMPLAMLTSAFSAVVLLPALVMTTKPTFLFKVRPSEWIELHTRGKYQKYNVDGDVLRKPKK